MIAKVQMIKNRMFPMFLQVETLFNLKATIEDNNQFWYLNFHRLKLLVQKNIAIGLPMIDILDPACEECLLGNQHRNSFPIGRSKKAKQPLELVYTDICDLGEVRSFGQKIYFDTL